MPYPFRLSETKRLLFWGGCHGDPRNQGSIVMAFCWGCAHAYLKVNILRVNWITQFDYIFLIYSMAPGFQYLCRSVDSMWLQPWPSSSWIWWRIKAEMWKCFDSMTGCFISSGIAALQVAHQLLIHNLSECGRFYECGYSSWHSFLFSDWTFNQKLITAILTLASSSTVRLWFILKLKLFCVHLWLIFPMFFSWMKRSKISSCFLFLLQCRNNVLSLSHATTLFKWVQDEK